MFGGLATDRFAVIETEPTARWKPCVSRKTVFDDKRMVGLTLLCSIPLLLSGCSQKAESPGAVAAPAVSTAPGVQGEADLSAVLHDLTQAVRKYSIERRQKPKTFNEVVAAGYVRNLPEPPRGQRFEIDPKTMQVVLVKQ